MITKYDAYPYQLDALRAVKSLTYAAIFHEQGLGKTKIAIDLMLTWLNEDIVDTVFVITKKSLVRNWCDELESHSYITPKVLSRDRRLNSIALNSPVLIYVMNYEVVSTNLNLIQQFLRTCRVGSILDESQKIKNPETNLSMCFHSISTKFERRVIMTGTPVANRPYDIWSQIRFLDNGASLGEFGEFKSSLDIPTNSNSDSNYSGRLVCVLDQIKHFSVRETKQTAGIQLPNKEILTHKIELAPLQSKIYASYRERMSYELRATLSVDNAEVILKRLLRLVQCASNPVLVDETYNEYPAKFLKLLKILDDITNKGSKALIWTGFIKNIGWLNKELTQYQPQLIHGQMSVHKRNESIRKFKTDKNCRILLATPGAAKEGLTLTVANHAVFFDRSFSLDDYLQAQDRIHRISQTDECFVHNLIAQNTIDEWVDTLLNAKFQAAQLAQGDISKEEFDTKFTFDLCKALEKVL